MDISKFNFDIIGLSETCLSSDIKILHHVPSWDYFTNNRITPGGGVFLYMRDIFDENKQVNFSVMLQRLEIINISFSVGEIN